MTQARPSIPDRLARRLDRLSLTAHRFHRFAHHPLCAEYAGEVFRLGRKTRLCKGCTLVALGAVVGLAAGGLAPQLADRYFALIALGLVPMITGAFLLQNHHAPVPQPPPGSPGAESLSASHGVPPRRGKLLSRFLPSAIFACTVIQGLRSGGAMGYAGSVLAIAQLVIALAAYRRLGPQRLPCRTCPERFGMSRCRGFSEIRRRERAFQRLAGWLIQRAGN